MKTFYFIGISLAFWPLTMAFSALGALRQSWAFALTSGVFLLFQIVFLTLAVLQSRRELR